MGAPAPIKATVNIRCPILILNGEADTSCTPDKVHQVAAE